VNLTAIGDNTRRYHRHSKFPPTKVGAHVFVIDYGLKPVAWISLWLYHQRGVKTYSMNLFVVDDESE